MFCACVNLVVVGNKGIREHLVEKGNIQHFMRHSIAGLPVLEGPSTRHPQEIVSLGESIFLTNIATTGDPQLTTLSLATVQSYDDAERTCMTYDRSLRL